MIKFKEWLLLHKRVDFFETPIEEGLMYSYPIESTRNWIKNLQGFQDISPIFDESNFNVKFSTKSKNLVDFLEDFEKQLKTYGYFISKVLWNSDTDVICSIEMKYPREVSKVIIVEKDWYHITNSQYLDKIVKIGLGPKGTTTEFRHPGNRVYLIQINETDPKLDILAKRLFDEKLKNIINSNRSGSKVREDNWKNSKMVLLKVRLTNNFKVLYDPAFDRSGGYIAGFTMDYISPSQIDFVREF